MFDSISEDVMAEGAWTSATSRATLVKSATAPVYGYANQFQLPTDPFCLRVLDVNETEPGAIKWVREGDKVLTDSDTLSIRYIFRVTNTESYDTKLKQAIIARLSYELSYELVSSRALTAQLGEAYNDIKRSGLVTDGKQGSARQFSSTALTRVR